MPQTLMSKDYVHCIQMAKHYQFRVHKKIYYLLI